VLFVLDEGAIGEDLSNADLPQLVYEDCEVVDEPAPPGDIPVGAVVAWTTTSGERRSSSRVSS
jgi:hypothetical protein